MVALATLALVACSGDRPADGTSASADAATRLPASDAESSGSIEVDIQYAPELSVDLNAMARMPSGLYLKDVEVGDSKGDLAINGRRLSVKYTGWLSSGVEFDSNRDSKEGMAFTLGTGDVIKGWEEGLQGMRPGGRRMLVIPPALGYGERGYPGVIPPGATLVFDVMLVSVAQ
jgi:FKBP-type peptidyl-prolyl cis-trans isomerase